VSGRRLCAPPLSYIRLLLLPGSIEVSGPDFYCHRGQLVHCPWGEEPSYSLSLLDRKLTFGKCTTCTLG
jgi:hypothetical protein